MPTKVTLYELSGRESEAVRKSFRGEPTDKHRRQYHYIIETRQFVLKISQCRLQNVHNYSLRRILPFFIKQRTHSALSRHYSIAISFQICVDIFTNAWYTDSVYKKKCAAVTKSAALQKCRQREPQPAESGFAPVTLAFSLSSGAGETPPSDLVTVRSADVGKLSVTSEAGWYRGNFRPGRVFSVGLFLCSAHSPTLRRVKKRNGGNTQIP